MSMSKSRIKTIAALCAFQALSIGATWAQAPLEDGAANYQWGPHMMWWGGTWSSALFGILFMLLFFLTLMATALVLARWVGWSLPTRPLTPGQTPLDILKDRFARGEIDKEEYEERRRVLGE
jgi:putative membrane protein